MNSKSILFILNFLITFCYCDNVELESHESITISAVGRVASLGDLYDARTEKFTYFNLFTDFPPDTSITTTSNAKCEIHYTATDSFRKKFDSMNIEAQLQLSILSDLVTLTGSAKYLNAKKHSAKSAKASLILSCETVYEQISITHKDITPLINGDLFKPLDATHFVVGIQWGGKVSLSVEDMNEKNSDQQTVQGNLEIAMKEIKGVFSASGNAGVDITEEQREKFNAFSFDFYGDYTPTELPTTLIDALTFIQKAPSLVQKANDGRGKPLKYALIPIKTLNRITKFNITEIVVKRIDETTVKKCVELFDQMNLIEQQINDLVGDVEKLEEYIKSDTVENILSLKKNFKFHHLELKTNLSKSLILVRSGKETVEKLEEIISQSINLLEKFKNKLNEFSNTKTQIDLLKLVQSKNVTLIKEEDLINFEWNYDDIYILYHNYSQTFTRDLDVEKFLNIIIETQENQTNGVLFFTVNNEILKFDQIESSKVFHCFQGECTEVSIMMLSTSSSIDNNSDSLVPINFTYTQLPYQSEPKAIWPEMKWEDVTLSYEGFFFRAEGGNSSEFGEVQEENAPRVEQIEFCRNDTNQCEPTFWNTSVACSVNQGEWTEFIPSTTKETKDTSLIYHRYYTEGGEIRPFNMAIRIWKRIG